MRKTILIVDDQADIRNLVKEILEDEGYATLTAENSKKAYEVLENEKPDMAILDIWLQDSRHDGLQILETIKAGQHKDIPVIMISGHGTIETAVNAIKQGAYDFIEKPFKSDRLLLMVQRGLEAASLLQENTALKERSRNNIDVIGDSYHAKNLRERIKVLAKSNSNILIEGPLGAGKTTIAGLIHNASEHANAPFIVHMCGSQSDAQGSFEESIEAAKGGYLVFQDIDGLHEEDQKQLLSLLTKTKLSFRMIATSRTSEALNDNLKSRIGVETLTVPSLNDRKQDIETLLDVYVRQVALELGVKAPSVSREVVRLCENYQWQGNLYELQAAMIWALIHNEGHDVIQPKSLPVRISGIENLSDNVENLPVASQGFDDFMLDLPLREAREVFEREYLTSQVDRFEGNISKTAQFIGMERSALHRKIKSLQSKDKDTSDQKVASAQN